MPARRKKIPNPIRPQRGPQARMLEAIGYGDRGDPPTTGTGDDRKKRRSASPPAPKSMDPVDVYVRKRRAARKKK